MCFYLWAIFMQFISSNKIITYTPFNLKHFIL
jgi:hypothetical protein